MPGRAPPRRDPLARLEAEIVRCRACPRLVAWREEVARVKRRVYRDEAYWGRPVPSFGDPAARVVLVGLADRAVQEAKTRVAAAIRNIQVSLPSKRVVVNLAPGDLRKDGTGRPQ